MTSGKYLPRSCPALECTVTEVSVRVRRQRKPSHLGSYCQSGPAGISATERASMASWPELLRPVMYQPATYLPFLYRSFAVLKVPSQKGRSWVGPLAGV